jgi:hypothetical protein
MAQRLLRGITVASTESLRTVEAERRVDGVNEIATLSIFERKHPASGFQGPHFESKIADRLLKAITRFQ